MPAAKKNSNAAIADDSRSEISATRERQIAAAAHARKSKAQQLQHQNINSVGYQQNGTTGRSSLKELALSSTDRGDVVGSAAGSSGGGMNWPSESLALLNTYRVAHSLSTPASFTSCLHQARLTNSSLGKQSPTMARKKEKRRVPKEQLALAVRKHFNGAAVSEIDVVVELVYKVKHQDKAFRMRSLPGGRPKKSQQS